MSLKQGAHSVSSMASNSSDVVDVTEEVAAGALRLKKAIPHSCSSRRPALFTTAEMAAEE